MGTCGEATTTGENTTTLSTAESFKPNADEVPKFHGAEGPWPSRFPQGILPFSSAAPPESRDDIHDDDSFRMG